MIDPLRIFEEINKVCKECIPNINVYAFGSRLRGTSTRGKWDFDVSIDSDKLGDLKIIKLALDKHFEGRIDENGKFVKIDVFRTRAKNIDEFKKSISYAVLL